MSVINVSRRDFVKIASVASAGLILATELPLLADTPKNKAAELGPFLVVGNDGIVTIFVSKSDMGQGVRTSLPMIVAEELDADWKKVRIEQAPLDKKFGRMGTGGSSSTRTMWMPMRQAGAAARARKATFGELAEAASALSVPKEIPLKDPARFTIIGKSTDRLDNADIVRGKAGYGIDVKRPDMLYGAVKRSPVLGGKVASFDATKAKALPGVVDVVKIDATGFELPWSGVGVIADSTWAALRARDAIEVTWDEGAAKSETSESLRKSLDELTSVEGRHIRNDGDVDAALASAAKKLEARYEVPYLAHATMEPMNATAQVTADGATLWLPTQSADWAATSAAKAVGLKPEQVAVNVTLLGGGFGRRSMPDCAIEAALLAKAAKGRPVHVQWTREDDMQHDYYRPTSVHRVMAGLDADGKLIAYRHRMASPSISASMGRGEHESETGGIDDLPLSIPNLRLEYALGHSAATRGWWRSVENSGNAFVVQSFLDEVAHATGKDPIDFQLAMLPAGKTIPGEGGGKNYPFTSDRLRHVIELARDRSDWLKPAGSGRARGFAAWWSFFSYVAEVAEVSVENGGAIRVHRVTAVIDCGTPVNPDGIAAQVEGGIVYGLTAALKGAITLDAGRVAQSNFHDYELLRFNEMPHIDVHIVPSRELPSGTGEPGLPPIAPAVANAVFTLTGKRLRQTPFVA